jgi:hypothetical protein
MLAARFVDALDASSDSELVDPAYLGEGRVYVHVAAEGALAGDAARLSREVGGLRVLGLPVRVVETGETSAAPAPAVLLNVGLGSAANGEIRGRVVLFESNGDGHWMPLGKTSFTTGSTPAVLDGGTLARAIDRSVASSFVTVKTAKKGVGATTLRVENRLPFTLSNLALKTGDSAGSPTVAFPGLGVAPGRSAVISVQTPIATVEHVDVNGL